ncbi:MAG: glycosyltransferase family 2 protein [Spirochaetota bacterium]
MLQLSLILPSFNERDNLLILIPILQKLFHENKISYEIIVVDDDSPDLTWKAVQDQFAKQEEIHVIRRIGKKGLSSAVIDGMAVARGTYFAVMDADMQHDEKILPQMLQEMNEHEIVIGSRLVGDGGYGDWGIVRKLMSKGATLVAKLFLPIQVKDPMSGYFVIRRELFNEIGDKINPIGFKILLEFLGRKKGIRSKEVGYVFRTRIHGATKMSGSVIQNYLAALYDIRFGKYVSLTFISYAIVGFLGYSINLFSRYLFSFFFRDSSKLFTFAFTSISTSATLAFVFSIMNNYFLNNYWTFRRVKNTGFYQNLRGLTIFVVISLIGLFIQLSVWNYSILLYKQSQIGSENLFINIVCNFIGIVFATATNFYLNKNITWNLKD